jgi:hypothetical protein
MTATTTLDPISELVEAGFDMLLCGGCISVCFRGRHAYVSYEGLEWAAELGIVTAYVLETLVGS